ncbi:MAG TPA: PAS domain S-box protein, partial [Candidatus Bathyarchaeia archaeon]|nr:PAS domain S-box protein [Candidatus Bathyarchaeia archaeon]
MVESASGLSVKVDAADLIRNEKKDRALRESEERYRLLFEQSPIGISITTTGGNIIDANKTLCAIVGYSEDELKKIRVTDLYESPERRDALLEALERDGAVSDFSARLKRKDGSSFDAVMNVSRIHVGGRNLLQTTVQDITERRKTEETLKQSEEKYRNLVENARDTILTYDPTGIISSANKKIEDYGFRRDQFIGNNMFKFIPKKYWPRLIKEHSNIASGNPTEGEIEVITPTGKINVEYKSNPVRQGDKVIGAQTILRDVTERKKAEEAIRESEQKFRSIFEGVADGVAYLDKLGRILDVNRRAIEIFGGSRQEIVGKRFTEIGIFSLKDTLALTRNLATILRGKKTVLNVEIKNKNGQVISLECSTSILKTGDRTMIAAVLRDISERKKMEEDLKQSEQKFKSLFERSPEALAYVDSRLEILDINPSFTELFGYTKEEALGKDLDNLIVPADKESEAEELNERAIRGNVHHDTVRKTKQGSL